MTIIYKQSISFLFALLSYCLLHAGTAADSSYRILWFTGKKISNNKLLTATGDTVSFNPSTGTVKVISKTGTGKQLDNMMRELQKTPQRINEMMQRLSSQIPKNVLPYYTAAVEQSFERIEKNFKDGISNTMLLPELKISNETPSVGKGPSYTLDEEAIDPLDKPIAEILAWVQQHRKDDFNVPEPPSTDLSYCAPCNEAANKEYDAAFERFRKEMYGEAEEMMRLTLSVMRHAQLFFSTGMNAEVNAKLQPAMDFFRQRIAARAKLLIQKYMNDPQKINAVMMIVLPLEREQQLRGELGCLVTCDFNDIFDRMMDALITAAQNNDYPVALNIQLILETERSRQLLGRSRDNKLDVLLSFNQFKMTVNIAAKVSGDGGYTLSQAKGKNYFAAVPDDQCKLKWILLGPDTKKMKYDLVAAELKGPGATVDYIGTRDWQSNEPIIRLDFCNSIPDTVDLFTLSPHNLKETWRYPPPTGDMNTPLVNVSLMNCFMDIEQVKKDAAYYKNSANVEKMKNEMQQQQELFMKNNKALMQKNPSQWTAAERKRMAEPIAAMNAGSKVNNIVSSFATGRYRIMPEQKRNRSKIILQEKLNGKELFPQNGTTEYAWLHITMEQDPDSPYKFRELLSPK